MARALKQRPMNSPEQIAKMHEADKADDDLRESLESLCRSVAALDDAGLPLEHKSAINAAKKLLRKLS